MKKISSFALSLLLLPVLTAAQLGPSGKSMTWVERTPAAGGHFFRLWAPDDLPATYEPKIAITENCDGALNGGKLTINGSDELVCDDDIGGLADTPTPTPTGPTPTPTNTPTPTPTATPISANVFMRAACFQIGKDTGSVLVDGDDNAIGIPNDTGFTWTVTKASCRSDAASSDPTVMLRRNDGSVADMLSGNLTCDNDRDGGTTTSFSGSENVIADGDTIPINVVTAGGVAKVATVCVAYTVP